MMTDPFRDDHQPGDFAASAPARAHAARALDQAAAYAAALAIARWSSPTPPAHTAAAADAGFAARAAWYSKTQDQLQQFFDAGGFCAAQPGDQAAGEKPAESALPFPGSRPRFYTLCRTVRSTTE
ncbi:MAG: hypothetical protein ACJ8HI_03760 [Massilia sp.]